MVKVSVVMSLRQNEHFKDSIESVLNQSIDDVEVICIGENEFAHDRVRYVADMESAVKEIKGKYVYFLNQGDTIDGKVFENCYKICEKKNLDFIQFDGEDEFDSEVYSFILLKAKVFKMDMNKNTKFIKSKILEKIGSLSDDDYIFFWDLLFAAKKFSFYPASVRSKDASESYEHKVELIEVTNRVFTMFTDRDYIGRYKFLLFDWRLETLYDTYLSVDDESKADYYECLKEDFTRMVYHWRFADFAYDTKPINMLFFNDIVYSKDFDDFKRLMVQYELALDSERIRSENEIIKKNIDILKKENDKIFNSTSWKITKPLRGLK